MGHNVHRVPRYRAGPFGCGLLCGCFEEGSLREVEAHELTCSQLFSFLPFELWLDPSNSEEMALPMASVLQVLHGPLIKLQLDRRDEIAVVSAAGAVVVAWWKKLLHPPEEWAQQSLISRLCQSIRSQPSPSRLRQC